MNERQNSALDLAKNCYRTFPVHGVNERGECTCGNKNCGSIGKHPVIQGWQAAATTDQNQIKTWWEKYPDANPAVATGKGLLVLDVDGETGKKSLKDLEEKHGTLPETRTVETGGGGLHYYFRVSQRLSNKVGFMPGLDIRCDGGYVVAPGAKHRSGNMYRWDIFCSPEDCEEAEAPAWLLDLLNNADDSQQSQTTYTEGDRIPKGQRNETLFKYGCFLRGQRNTDMKDIAEILHKLAAENCDPPYPKNLVDIIIHQVDRFPRGGGPEQAFQSTGLIRASEVPDEEPVFVINPYIPEGQLTMIQGYPGEGKTAFACKLAALVSTGGDLLGLPCASGNVLVLSVEDDLSVLRRRIVASGGDPDKCFFMENSSGLTFQSPELEQRILEAQAKLVIFDPLQAFLGANVDMHRANETRPVLAALKEMAHRNKCAIVIISHMNKGQRESAAITRSLGSIDIPGACRSVFQIGRIPEKKRLMVHVKSSAAEEGKSIIFSIGHRGMVTLESFSNMGCDAFSTVGAKARKAAEDPFMKASVTAACRRILAEHPKGAKVEYTDMGVAWPTSRPSTILDELKSALYAEGIFIKSGEKVPPNGRRGVMIAPVRPEDL